MNTSIEGRVWVFGDSVNTDAMYPGHAMRLPYEEAARFVFHELRPGWTGEVRDGDIVVAGRNFGVGSSRPVAKLFTVLGVSALIADEFNSLFYRNCVNYGLPALTAPGVQAAFSDGDTAFVDIASGRVENRTAGTRLQGQGLPEMLLDILDAGGLMPRLTRDGYLPS